MGRGDPQRIYEAQRAGLRNRIRDSWRVPEDRADTLLSAWEVEAASRGVDRRDPQYWPEAERWVEEQLGRR